MTENAMHVAIRQINRKAPILNGDGYPTLNRLVAQRYI
jgi:hypothetical protein